MSPLGWQEEKGGINQRIGDIACSRNVRETLNSEKLGVLS